MRNLLCCGLTNGVKTQPGAPPLRRQQISKFTILLGEWQFICVLYAVIKFALFISYYTYRLTESAGPFTRSYVIASPSAHVSKTPEVHAQTPAFCIVLMAPSFTTYDDLSAIKIAETSILMATYFGFTYPTSHDSPEDTTPTTNVRK